MYEKGKAPGQGLCRNKGCCKVKLRIYLFLNPMIPSGYQPDITRKK